MGKLKGHAWGVAQELAADRIKDLPAEKIHALCVDLLAAHWMETHDVFVYADHPNELAPEAVLQDHKVRDLLWTEVNLPHVAEAFLEDAAGSHEIGDYCESRDLHPYEKGILSAFFEHGQWFVECPSTGRQWSVNDRDPGFFSFEVVSEGEE